MLPEMPGNYPPRIDNIFWLYDIRILEHGKRYKIAIDSGRLVTSLPFG